MSENIGIIGHRGWPVKYPDNTLSGFLAVAPFCDAIELDVRRSADGKLVLAHDEFLGEHHVGTTPWPILAEVDLGGGHRPCLLDEAIAATPGTPLMIEIKNNPGERGFEPDHRLGLEAASRARPEDIVTSFNWATADAVRRVFPDVATGLIVGVLGDVADTVGRAAVQGHEYVIPNIRLLDTSDQARRRAQGGIRLWVWASEEHDLLGLGHDELVSRGVSGIITDDPLATRHRFERAR